MRRRLGPALVVAVLLATGCSSLRVATDHDPAAVATIASYASYGWLASPEGDDPVLHNRLLAMRIEGAVDDELAGKGYRRIDRGAPDFRVGWHASVEGKVDVSTVNNYYGYDYGTWGVGGGSAYTDNYVREYQQGTLILDVVDGVSNELVWRGTAQAEVSMSDDAEKREKRIRTAVNELFRDFPPSTDHGHGVRLDVAE